MDRMGGERSLMPQHAILRFAKHKAGPAGALEAHHERTKEKYYESDEGKQALAEWEDKHKQDENK